MSSSNRGWCAVFSLCMALHVETVLSVHFNSKSLTSGTPSPNLMAVGLASSLEWCLPRTGLISRHGLPERAHKKPTGQGAWLRKGGDAGRSGLVAGRQGPSDVSVPRWSFYQYHITYSTPLVDEEGNIYVAPTDGKVFSLAQDGKSRWSYHLKGANPGNPVMAHGLLFVSDHLGFAYALDSHNGSARWVRRVAKQGSPGNYALAAGAGLVFLHADLTPGGWSNFSDFIACDARTGEERWRFTINDAPFFNVMPAVTEDGTELVFTDMDGGVHKHEVATGRELWRSPGFPFPLTPEANWMGGSGGAPRSHSALALVADGVVYSAGNPTRSTGRVRALRLDTGAELWHRDVDRMMANAAALAVLGGVRTLVFGTGVTALHPIPEAKPPFIGTLYALDASTGEERWHFRSEPMLTPVCPGTVVNPVCQRGNLPDSWSAPAIDAAGRVYVGWQGGILYVLDGHTGQLISQFNSTEAIQSQPAIGPRGELVLTSGMHTHSFW